MKLFNSAKQLIDSCNKAVEVKENNISITNPKLLRETVIDTIIYNGVLSKDADIKNTAYWLIWEIARKLNIRSASIQSLYEARGKKHYNGKTVPAVNIRGLTYYVARGIFRSAIKNNVGAFIFEIAKSEMAYTFQRPKEYTMNCIAAAIKEGFSGSVFIQGDHFQVNAKKYKENPQKEIEEIKNLIREAIEAGFYNIDIDTSTLVDLSEPTLDKQQFLNYSICASLTKYIRDLEPEGITISIGGEIGEVGEKNSTVEELKAFMNGYFIHLKKEGNNIKGISKISVQTGTSHGGVPLPDGSVADVKLDFDTLKDLSIVSRDSYGLSGAVQHGASTLPDDAFHRFPEAETAEVHLATGFQNMIYESSHLPDSLKESIYKHLKDNFIDEKKEQDSHEQFIYKTRKKGFGPFKKELFDLSDNIKINISIEIENKFDFLFKKLDVINTKNLVDKHVKPVDIPKTIN